MGKETTVLKEIIFPELRAMQNKDKIYAPEEFTLHGAFFCLMFYSATARHEIARRAMNGIACRTNKDVATEMERSGIEVARCLPQDNCLGVFFILLR